MRRLASRRSAGSADGAGAEDGPAGLVRGAPDGYHVLAVRTGGQVFGLPVEQVREIITLESLTPLPVERRGLMGLANIRGEVVPVFDLKGVLDGTPADPGSGRRTDVVVVTGFGPMVLRADGILGTVRGPAEELTAPAGDPGPLGRLVSGVVPMPDCLLQVLDLERLAAAAFGQA